MFVHVVFLALMIACALYDLFELRIPNVLTAGLAVLFVVQVLVRPLPLAAVGGHVLVGAIVFVCAAMLYRYEMIGGGDVKLLAVASLWAGPNLFLAHLLLTSIAALALLAATLLARQAYFFVLASVPRLGAAPIPPVLKRGAGFPYGIAIAAAAILLDMPSAP